MVHEKGKDQGYYGVNNTNTLLKNRFCIKVVGTCLMCPQSK